jgi:DNA polymerase III subunit gamma/tau
MAYEPLARKYRPQIFEELIGQDALVRALKNTLALKKIHPAYIFSGIRGVGKTTVARIFAKGLNCEKGITPKPCNECVSCKEITRGFSIDMLEIDGATHTGADEARLIADMAKYTPSRDRFRIFLIDEVHMLSKAAFNALLKTLEEPPPQALFLFATTEPQKIPETIDSRSYHFRLKRISEEMIYNLLKSVSEKEGIQIDEGALKLVARYGDGSMRDSLTLLDRLLSYAGLERITELMASKVLGIVGKDFLIRTALAVVNCDKKLIFSLLDELFSKGDDPERFLSDLMNVYREVLRGKASLEISEDLLEIANKSSLEDILKTLDILVGASQKIKQAVDQRTVLELELIKVASLPVIVPIDKILKGTDNLSYGLFKEEGVDAKIENKEKEREEETQKFEEVSDGELSFKSLVPFQRMDEEEANSFNGFNPITKSIKEEIIDKHPVAQDTIEKSSLTFDPNGNLHIIVSAKCERQVFEYLKKNKNSLLSENFARENKISGKIFIEMNGIEDLKEEYVKEAEEEVVEKRKQGTLTLLKELSGEIVKIEKGKKEQDSGGEDAELE